MSPLSTDVSLLCILQNPLREIEDTFNFHLTENEASVSQRSQDSPRTGFSFFTANIYLKFNQDVFGAYINKLWPGSDTMLNSYWSRASERGRPTLHILRLPLY
jgi:hypothetical protein